MIKVHNTDTSKFTQMSTRRTGDYEIIMNVETDRGDEVVIAVNTIKDEYVCWYCVPGRDDYYSGVYTDTFEDALEAMLRRL